MKTLSTILFLIVSVICVAGAWAYIYLPGTPRWSEPTTSFHVDLPVADNVWNNAFESAMFLWNSRTIFTYLIQRNSYADPCNLTDGRNGVAFTDTVCGVSYGDAVAIAAAPYDIDASGTRITEAGIVFDRKLAWNVYSGPQIYLGNGQWLYDFQRTAVHELGHTLGLDHEDRFPSIMCGIRTPACTAIETPQPDDIAGVNALYSNLPPPPASVPTFNAAGLTNGASFVTGVTPGFILTIFGSRLSQAVGIVQASTLPLPTQLLGTSVTVNSIPAPLFAIANVNGQEQINLQVPWEVAGQASVNIVVNNNGQFSAPLQVAMTQTHPGLFTVGGTNGAILHANGQLVTALNPANKGETVSLYATGLGPVANNPGTGRPAAGNSRTTITPTVAIGAFFGAPVQFSGLAPGFVGLYQVNVTIPTNAASGVQNVLLSTGAGGLLSNPVRITIR